MRNIRNHTRTSVIKVKFSKAVNGVCKLYSSLQRKLAERFEDDDNVETFETNVKVDELPIDGTFTSDFLVKFKDGSFKVYECVLRRHITKPMTMKLLSLSRGYWMKKGVGFAIATETEENGKI